MSAEKILARIPKGGPVDLLPPDVTPEDVSMGFHRFCKKPGDCRYRPHDLRRTFAAWLCQRGTGLDVIASQLGRRDLKMNRRYARIASAQVREAGNGLDSVSTSAQGGQTADVSHPLVTETLQLPEARIH